MNSDFDGWMSTRNSLFLSAAKLVRRSIGFLMSWKIARIKDGILRIIRHER